MRQNEIGREMRFASLSIPGKPDHYRWLVTISEEESPEILKVWDRYCGNVATLDRYHRMLEEGEPDPLQVCNPYRNTEEDDEEEKPREKPWPKEAVRNFVREAKANMMKEKQVWNMERRRYWPCRLVVDNTVNKR